MNQTAQTKMTTNELPSPLELAHLSIALVQAGMLPGIDAPAKRVRASLFYLETCSDLLEEKRRKSEDWEESLKHIVFIDKFLSQFGHDEKVPLVAILKYCNAQRIKPSQNELKEIGESRLWEQLSKAEQMSSIYLVLTKKVTRPLVFVGSFELRRQWIANGFSHDRASIDIGKILKAKKMRQSEKGKEGVKRRKPRAPKGPAGPFEKKKRNQAGEYGKQ